MPSKNETKPVLCVGITPAAQRTLQFMRFEPGEVNRARGVVTSASGKAVNMAMVLDTLGTRPLVTGLIGGDTGQAVLAVLARRHIAADFVKSIYPTRVCTTILDATTGVVTELVEEARLPPRREWEEFNVKLTGLLVTCRFVAISGALPPRAPDYIYANIAQKAATLGIPLLIDSQGLPLINTLAYQPLLVKLNRRELAKTCGLPLRSEAETIEAARDMRGRGAQWVLVTHGSAPAVLVGPGPLLRYPVPKVRTVNTVGCGDSVSAGVVHGLARGLTMPEAVRIGIACGVAKAGLLTPSELRREDINRVLPQIQYHEEQG